MKKHLLFILFLGCIAHAKALVAYNKLEAKIATLKKQGVDTLLIYTAHGEGRRIYAEKTLFTCEPSEFFTSFPS